VANYSFSEPISPRTGEKLASRSQSSNELLAANIALAIAFVDLGFRQGFPAIGARNPSQSVCGVK
jgi:hypothetical protein